jgi:hypothetical protein
MGWLADIEARLCAAPVRRLIVPGDAARESMLVPLYVNAGQLWLVLVREAGRGTGELALPGGPVIEADHDEVETAVRAGAAALGIAPHVVLVVGQLDQQQGVDGSLVSPVVAALPFPLKLMPAAGVEAIASVPLMVLARPRAVEALDAIGRDGQPTIGSVLHYPGFRLSDVSAAVVTDLLGRVIGAAPVSEWLPKS